MLYNAVQFAKTHPLLDTFWRYNPLYYGNALAIARLPAGEQLKQQQALVARTLRWARDTRYGREYNSPVLEDWPLLDKEEIRQQPGYFKGKVLLPLSAKTGGSTGVPLPVWRTVQNIAAEQAFFDAMLSPWNLSFRTARIAILRGDNIKSPNDRTPPFGVQRGRQLVLSFPHLAADTFAWYKQELRRFKPDILWIYPTGGDFLASLYQQHGASLKIPVVFSSSEMLSADAFGRLQQVFGATVLNYYGQAERVCLAWQTKPHEAWFVPGYGKVELRPTDREAPEGYRAAAVYATSLWNKAMPLVRYNTGDAILYPEAVPDSDLSDIANGLKPFTTLLGRESEYLVTPGGGRIQALNHVPRGVRALRVQLIQHAPERLEIRASPAAGFNSDDEALLLSNARAKIPADIAIEIVTDKPLERTASHKTPFVIRQFQ